jgi:hypothetical protein
MFWIEESTMTHRRLSVVAALGLATTLGLGRQASANDPAKFDAMFTDMDANSDGRISEDEHAAWARQKFQRMDSDGDGRVTASEMKAEKSRMHDKAGKNEMSAEEKIKAVDGNGDGVLSREEHETASKIKFDQMDTDKDGTLSKSEIKVGHAKMMTKRTSTTTTTTTTTTKD